MNTFKKKSLYAALAGVSALGVTGAAQAVSVNPDGLGQALIYPYYTVRDKVAGAPYTSLLTVVNSTASAKAVKVRFLEGKNSREVLDFNLYLSKKDVWVAAIIPTTNGGGIYTPDTSCTTPTVSNNPAAPTEFVNFAYTGSAADGADTSLDRTREGYVEIIEMGNIVADSPTEDAVTHVGGVPPGPCSVPSASADTVTGNGGLFGSMQLINVLSGEDFGVEAVALEGFSTTPLWFSPGSILPTLELVNPKTSVVTTGFNTYVTDWSAPPALPVDPVSAVFMHNDVYNEFVVETGTKSGTDWVMTMPTKRFYINVGPGSNPGRLFQRNFNGNAGSCDDVIVTQFDREERTIQAPGQFSPPPPTQVDSLCWEANVLTLNGTNVFASKNLANVPTTFQNGWLAINFSATTVPATKHVLIGGGSTVFNTTSGTTTSLLTTTFSGLPVVGFAAITFNNSSLPLPGGGLIQSNYGGALNHKFTRVIQ